MIGTESVFEKGVSYVHKSILVLAGLLAAPAAHAQSSSRAINVTDISLVMIENFGGGARRGASGLPDLRNTGTGDIGFGNSGNNDIGFFNGGNGNIGAFNGFGNTGKGNGNYNTGFFNGSLNTGNYNGNGNVGSFNGNLNGGSFNGNRNIGSFNGNLNGSSFFRH